MLLKLINKIWGGGHVSCTVDNFSLDGSKSSYHQESETKGGVASANVEHELV